MNDNIRARWEHGLARLDQGVERCDVVMPDTAHVTVQNAEGDGFGMIDLAGDMLTLGDLRALVTAFQPRRMADCVVDTPGFKMFIGKQGDAVPSINAARYPTGPFALYEADYGPGGLRQAAYDYVNASRQSLAREPATADVERLREMYEVGFKDGGDGDYNPDTALSRAAPSSEPAIHSVEEASR